MARLDTMVTVVDAVNLLNDFSSHDFLKIVAKPWVMKTNALGAPIN